jgi:dipeptidyl aminopeptidase/acylaminoacyl peptidase
MWLQDIRKGTVLAVTNHERLGIRGMAPGAKQEIELGWFGWSELRDISRDGRKILFEEEGDGGGANYTVFLRDTDGSPPARIGEGVAGAISPDGKWVVTKPAKGGQLMLVPTGAGEARQLTHDAVSYSGVQFFSDGKRLLAPGIEAGHGGRDYLIDVSTGDSKPVTPEGTVGVQISPDGKSTTVRGPDGKRGIWSLDGGGFHEIPGLQPGYGVIGWTPDGQSVYVAPRQLQAKTVPVSRVNIHTGKVEPWKTFGEQTGAGVTAVVPPHLASDGNAYAYLYVQVLSEAYVVTGLK